MFFKKERHLAEPLFKQHKVLNFEKQEILASSCFMWTVANKEHRSTITQNFPSEEKTYDHKNLKFHVPSSR